VEGDTAAHHMRILKNRNILAAKLLPYYATYVNSGSGLAYHWKDTIKALSHLYVGPTTKKCNNLYDWQNLW